MSKPDIKKSQVASGKPGRYETTFAEGKVNSQFLDFIQVITHSINQDDNPEKVLDQILQVCMESTKAHSGSIMLLDEKKKYLRVHAFYGLSPSMREFELQVGEGVSGWVALHAKPRLVHDARKETDYVAVSKELLSELAVPMLVEHEAIGVLSVDARHVNAFTHEQQGFLLIMANLIAQIFVNLKDRHLLKLRDRLHLLLRNISRVNTSSLHLKDIFREVMKQTEQAFRLHRSTLFIYNSKKDVLCIEASSELPGEAIQNISYAPGEGITGQVFLDKKPVFISNVREEPDFLNRMKISKSEEDMGFFCCPIFSADDVVGVFSTFTLSQIGLDSTIILEFLEILASSFSQAITIQKLIEDETRSVRFESLQLKQELSKRYQFGGLIAHSQLMHNLIKKARIVADTRATILITGDSGTGKELVASAIHYSSSRRDKPFIKLNCAAIPVNLLESELFGHRRGAFTGATSDKKGKFELANGGTIFLDEIGELSYDLQSKFLRILQEREIEPVGGLTRSIDVRVLAATNVDLKRRIQEKKFRSDLFYRLNVIVLHIPPLAERVEDILPLVHHFILRYGAENKKEILGVSAEAISLLEKYSWPGNVRQLENFVERAVILTQEKKLDVKDFEEVRTQIYSLTKQNNNEIISIPKANSDSVSGDQKHSISVFTGIKHPPEKEIMSLLENKLNAHSGKAYGEVIHIVERDLILLALRKSNYKKSVTARKLGINRNTLDKKIQRLNIKY